METLRNIDGVIVEFGKVLPAGFTDRDHRAET